MPNDSTARVMPGPTQADILTRLIQSTEDLPDRTVERIVVGACLVGVQAGPIDQADRAGRRGSTGLASRISPPQSAQSGEPPTSRAAAFGAVPDGVSELGPIHYDREPSPEKKEPPSRSAKGMARLLLSGDPDEATLGMAALNALLPPPPDGLEMKGQELLLRLGRGRDVCVIGHFPFVERAAGEFSNFWVVEKSPRPGDYPEERAEEFMARADVAVVTGTTLLNGTLAGLLAAWKRWSGRGANKASDRTLILMGPSCPFSPALFALGVDVLAGALVVGPEAALAGLAAGVCFRGLRGARTLLWPRPGLLIG